MPTDITTITFNPNELKIQFPTQDTGVSNKKYVDDTGNLKVAKTDIVDNLTTPDSTKVLSANQGKILEDSLVGLDGAKINKTSIVDNLNSTDATKVLAARQGKVLGDQLAALSGSLVFKGTLDASGSATQLDNAQVGWFWLVNTAGTLLGQSLGVGDEIYCDTAVTGTPADFSSFQVIPSAQGILRVQNGEVDFLNSLAKNVNFGNISDTDPSALKVIGTTDPSSRMFMARFSEDVAPPQIMSIKTRGSYTSPTRVLLNDLLYISTIYGYGSSRAHLGGDITWKASEDWTDSANGTTYQINKTKIGNSSSELALEIDGDNNIQIKENLVIDGTIQIKGNFPGEGKILTSSVDGTAFWESRTEEIVKRKFAILSIGVNSIGGTKATSIDFNTVFGTDFGSDTSKINIQLTPILNFNANDMIDCLVRQITTSGFVINSFRIDNSGSSWGASLQVSCTITQFI